MGGQDQGMVIPSGEESGSSTSLLFALGNVNPQENKKCQMTNMSAALWKRCMVVKKGMKPRSPVTLETGRTGNKYRAPGKSVYVVARNFFLLLLNCSSWPCLAVGCC